MTVDIAELQREADLAGIKLDVKLAFRALSKEKAPRGRRLDPEKSAVPRATDADRLDAMRRAEPWLWTNFHPNDRGMSPETSARYVAVLSALPGEWTRPEFCEASGCSPHSHHLDDVIAWLIRNGHIMRLRQDWQRTGRGRGLMVYRTINAET